MNDKIETYLPYLLELRQRCLRSLLVLGLTLLVACYYHQTLFYYLASPLLHTLTSTSLISISILTPMWLSIKFAFYFSLFITLPYHIYQFWQFIYPALHTYEKHRLRLILLSSIVLFYLGVAIAYGCMMPAVLIYIRWWLPPEIQLMPDIGLYLDFSLSLFILFGLIFEIPVLIMLLLSFGWIDRLMLKHFRPYVIVLAFILGMLLTPPDVLSQILVALPIWLLYELGLWLSRWWPSA